MFFREQLEVPLPVQPFLDLLIKWKQWLLLALKTHDLPPSTQRASCNTITADKNHRKKNSFFSPTCTDEASKVIKSLPHQSLATYSFKDICNRNFQSPMHFVLCTLHLWHLRQIMSCFSPRNKLLVLHSCARTGQYKTAYSLLVWIGEQTSFMLRAHSFDCVVSLSADAELN